MSVANAMRFDMLKKLAHGADVPDVAIAEAGAAQSARGPLPLPGEGSAVSLDGEVEHGALAPRQVALPDSSSP